MERPYFFAGAIFSAPSIKVDANPCTVIIAPLATNNKRKHNAKTVSLFLGCRQCKNRIQQTQNRKTLPENRNTNPKTEINIPKRKHVQKNTKLNHKTERVL